MLRLWFQALAHRAISKAPLAPLLLFMSASVPSVYAADELGPVVVTGTLTAKSVSDSPVYTEVVSQQELERTHAQTLKDALENIPGLQLSQIHGKSGYQVSLQGLNSDQVLVLIDGLPITNSTGSTTDVSQYGLATVNHIEVVKGASSAQYGSSAMGGVINVITRPTQPGARVTLESQAGSYGKQNLSQHHWSTGQRNSRATVAAGTQTLRAQLSAEQLNDDGFSITPSGWSQQGDTNQRNQYAGRVDWLPNKAGRFWFEANQYNESNDARYERIMPPQQVLPQQHLEKIKRDRLTGGGSWRWNNGTHISIKGVSESYRSNSDEYSNLIL